MLQVRLYVIPNTFWQHFGVLYVYNVNAILCFWRLSLSRT